MLLHLLLFISMCTIIFSIPPLAMLFQRNHYDYWLPLLNGQISLNQVYINEFSWRVGYRLPVTLCSAVAWYSLGKTTPRYRRNMRDAMAAGMGDGVSREKYIQMKRFALRNVVGWCDINSYSPCRHPSIPLIQINRCLEHINRL